MGLRRHWWISLALELTQMKTVGDAQLHTASPAPVRRPAAIRPTLQRRAVGAGPSLRTSNDPACRPITVAVRTGLISDQVCDPGCRVRSCHGALRRRRGRRKLPRPVPRRRRPPHLTSRRLCPVHRRPPPLRPRRPLPRQLSY